MTSKDFAKAYRTGYPSTVRFLLSTGVPADKADDVAQAGWTRGWERRTQLEEPRKIVSWINTISLNLFRKHLKRQRPTEELCDVPTHPRVNAATIDIRMGLGQCTLEDRELLESYYLEGYTSRELGEKKHCSSEAIRVRVLRAKRRFIAFLEPRNADHPAMT
jgi:RNA polymerase sigma factor (sigma-70 family)